MMRHDPTRRAFLTRAAALGCSAAASPFMTPIAMASAPGENRLVVIILRGALDGLDALRPMGDPHFAALRPSLSEGGTPLGDGFFALHPELSGLAPLWQSGELAFVPATSTPYRDKRSHFDGQDLLEAGIAGDAALARDGWLNRALTLMPGSTARTAFALGRERMLILDGAAPITHWQPGTKLELGPQARLLLDYLFIQDPLFTEAGLTALEMGSAPGMADAPRGPAGEVLARYLAEQMRAETRIASLSLSGFDTHQSQKNRLRPALRNLQTTLLTLRAELGPLWARTTVLAMTEFGRTARENGTGGTDHGTGGAMLLAGGALNGGRMIGGWPGLSEAELYAGRDLMPLRDVRAYAAWALRDMFSLRASDLGQLVFPGLDMGDTPGLLL
ncbi:DUF1501 domain-containing protein [Roseibaca sp. V10]|uniref:DUF1501 domain-containing protein n=2 Tax=Roseinatronobacter domitianus TaxID=2940293 RepID=A0ABT0M0N6_9RHOB|nr:DUF1501 domain-containing protein [Roseibaca domitiana]MCL1628419.1 DUF1501 domain-containing protein [Roseibaca domitiana]